MKQIFFCLILSVITAASDETFPGTKIWEANYAEFDSQFSKWQSQDDSSIPTIIENNSILHFDGAPTRFSGFATESISAPSGKYYIAIEFKGESGLLTGGYLGYERSDHINVQRTLGLNQKINKEFSQIFRFNSTGEWATYLAYLEVQPGVTIKLILEKTNYFLSSSENHNAYFRSIKVYDYDLCSGSCPAVDSQKNYQLEYQQFVFYNNLMEEKIFGDIAFVDDDSSKAKFTLQYPHNPICCMKPVFYLLDKEGQVSEDFSPTQSQQLDFQDSLILDKWEKTFTINEIEKLGCKTEDTLNKDGKDSVLHTCNIEMHFYYDNDESFSTKQKEYNYSKNNSEVVFKSKFYSLITKEDSTFFNSKIASFEANSLCVGICELETSLRLNLNFKLSKTEEYVSVDTTASLAPKQLNWGQLLYFQIKSTTLGYDFELLRVVIGNSNDEFVPFGEIFIKDFVSNQIESESELTFEMKIYGEAGIAKGQNFNLKFIVKLTERSSNRLLSDDELVFAQISEVGYFQAGEAEEEVNQDDNSNSSKEEENSSNFAGKLSFSILAILILFFSVYA